MAYGTKYYAHYKSGNNVRTVQLQLEGYSGPETEWWCSTGAPEDDQGDSDNLFGEAIVSKVVRLEFLFDQNYDLTEFVAEPRTYKAIILEGSKVLFEGWVEPYNTSRSYQKPRYYVSMTATCGLNRLSKNSFPQVEFNEGNLELNYFEIVQRCLATIGIDRALRVSVHTYQNAYPSSPNPLLSCEVNVFRYFQDGKWMDCQSILVDILEKFNAQLFLDDDTWVIRCFVDHALSGFSDAIEYPAGGGQISIPSWPGLIRDVNYTPGDPLGDSVTLQGGQISLMPRVRKYTVSVDFGGKEEPFANGGLHLWDVNGPIGWEGNMEPALGGSGWTKVETGIEGNPYALHIRGKAPKPYYKTHKKGLWPFRKTVKTPIEPEIWWESPKVEIKQGVDEFINIGFEYYTEANSAGFLYAIVLQGQDLNTGKIRTTYLKPTSGAPDLVNDFQLLTAPPHPKVDPVTGITQAKGVVDYNVDLTEITSTTAYKYWFRIWFYFSVDEAGKTGDEYTIYKVNGEKSSPVENDVPDGDSKYRATLESNPYESDEGETINLITGDYSEGFLGTTHGPMDDLTGKWSRRGRSEAISIYRAILLDRLAMTYHVPDVVAAKIKLLHDEDLKYSTLLRFIDRDPSKLYKIVRYSFNHFSREASVTAVEATYTELTDVKQRSYTDARGLLDEDPDGDAVYPGGGTPSGRIGAEDPFEEVDPEEEAKNARTGLFEDVPALTYVFGEESTESVNLADFFSELYLAEQDEEIEEEDRHNPYDFHFETKYKPTWISELSVVFLNLAATGKPTQIGSTSIVFEVTDDAFGVMKDVTVPVIVYPKTKLGYTLLEVGSGNPVEVGPLPGAYLPPAKADILISVSGTHDYYQFTLEGGGANGDAFKQTVSGSVPLTTSDAYQMFLEDNGVVLAEGVYRLFVYTAIDERAVCRQDITFVLGDEEFLSKVKFFLTDGGSDIGEIEPSGESIFPDPGAWDNRVVITDVEHDKAIVKLSKPDGTGIHERTITHNSPVTTGSYFVYEDDQSHPIGRYNVSVTLFLEGEQVMMRYADFTTIKKAPEAVGGLIQLLTKSASGVNFSVAATLPKTGVSAQTLPPTGWNLGSDAVTDEFDWEGDELFEFKGGSLFKVDIATFIGRPSFVEYGFPVTYSDYRAFDNFSSLSIGKIHGNNKTFRYIRSRKLGGQSGDVVAVMQADFSFGKLVAIEDDTPIEEPGSGYADFVAGAGMEEVVEDSIKRFNVRVDDESLEIFEEESPNDPETPGLNHLRIKEKGVLYKHFQDMPADTVLGRRGTVGRPGPILIKKLLADAVEGDLVTIDVIRELVEEALEGSIDGTSGYIPKFAADGHSLIDSVIREVSGNIGIGITPAEKLHVLGNIRATGSLYSLIVTGTPPIAVNSTTRVNNLNVDMLDDQHGPYYLDWDNFSNYKSVIVGTGMTGGGILSASVNVGLDFTYLDDRYSSSLAFGLPWNTVNVTPKAKFNSSSVDGPSAAIVHGIFIPQANSTTHGSSIAMRNTAMWIKSVEGGVWSPWIQMADQPWVTANFAAISRQIIAGTGLSGGGTLAADRTLSVVYGSTAGTSTEGNDPRVINGQTAYTWGNHALAGYMSAVYSSLDWNGLNSDGQFKINTSAVNNPIGSAGAFHGIWIPHQQGTTFGTALSFRNNGGYFRSLENGVWGSWLQFADRPWVTANFAAITRQIIAGTGLSGGGTLAADRTLSVVYGTAAGTSTEGNDSRVLNGQTAFTWGNHALAGYLTAAYSSDSWGTVNSSIIKVNTSSGDNPYGGATIMHGLWVPHNQTSNYGSEIAMRNGAMWFRSLENGGWTSWLHMADRVWVDAHTVGAGAGLTGGGTLGSSPVISMGLPSTLSNGTTNSTSGTTHTHAIQTASLVAGNNVSFSTSGANRILGSTDLTINVTSVPWNTGVSGKPTTLSGFGIVDAPTFSYLDTQLGGKENTFAKGSIVVGNGIAASGSLLGRLVGSGDVTFGLAWSGVNPGNYHMVQVDIYGRVVNGSNPNTLSGHGITDAYTKAEVNAMIAGIGTGLSGSGPGSKVAVWGSGNTLTHGIMFDLGTQISIQGHLVVQGGIAATPGSLPASGTGDGELRYDGGSYYYWHANTSDWRKIQYI